ncbi:MULTISPECIES: formyltransferase family protein [Bradyrhizobium]|jgi:methionyl-tRNA formyltransferase|uniref:formyltransferase family protein n=1 Tax=Bradyrhizobium TaxID=374 RepID=UPI000231CB00|nr:formyltransferase family protein [Bradyrhizobium japonicum]AJA62016.1 UDP-glucuronic acid dehydrogenase [Bradyrhizobium japonicum]KMK00817.1 UDP-glucuronic acid dehydrogenase [Bradyrhizobium japonicum]MBR0759537.1 UDP-glucuronic acid dehydrogenase [Bradyrhizobium japonicum]MCS3495034.1 methionyl-tRNA formyltransferase [Bradyrhizobium japonicum]MCS3541606.1 methionyl-tRNA formyltransferase [Bradyrhizobium japonicum]
MKISIVCSSASHPVYAHLEQWARLARASHDVELVQKKAELTGGDILFLISCHEIISAQDRARYGASLVIHASDLPLGRGWSPHIWQILEGKHDIVVSLLEAEDQVDTGAIWAQRHMVLEGHELYDEINAKLFAIEMELMSEAVAVEGRRARMRQDGRAPTYYRRRGPEDSRLDPNRSIAEQFELLRVVDPQRFPAFFDFRGHRYVVRIEKVEATDE